jgi:Na+-driven multidrug efflux pump
MDATSMLSPLLIFGRGPIPALRVAGAGVAMLLYYGGAIAALVLYLRSSRSPISELL